MIELSLRRTKADSPWSTKPALKSGLDIAPNPKLSRRFGESTRSRLFHLSMSSGRKETKMESILARCAGLDVHKESVEACVRRIEPNGRVHSETRHWGTMTQDLLEMADWLAAEESAGKRRLKSRYLVDSPDVPVMFSRAGSQNLRRISSWIYSFRRASMGSTLAARRAGM